MKSFNVILLAIALVFTVNVANATAYSKIAAPEPTAAQASIFSNDKMLINTPFAGNQTVTVQDHNGTTLGSFKVEALDGTVTIPAVTSTGSPVIYQVVLKNAAGKTTTKKVLVF